MFYVSHDLAISGVDLSEGSLFCTMARSLSSGPLHEFCSLHGIRLQSGWQLAFPGCISI